jgi:hypothetical protein
MRITGARRADTSFRAAAGSGGPLNRRGYHPAVPTARATMHRDSEMWVGRLGSREVRAASRGGCERSLRRLAGERAFLVVEVTPDLVGVSEAASLLGWDRRRVATYVERGTFPEPVASLASGRVWRREDVEAFGRDRARRPRRRIVR